MCASLPFLYLFNKVFLVCQLVFAKMIDGGCLIKTSLMMSIDPRRWKVISLNRPHRSHLIHHLLVIGAGVGERSPFVRISRKYIFTFLSILPSFSIEYLSIDAAGSSEAGRLFVGHDGKGGMAWIHEGRGRDTVAVGGEVGRVDQDWSRWGREVARHGGGVHGLVVGHGHGLVGVLGLHKAQVHHAAVHIRLLWLCWS